MIFNFAMNALMALVVTGYAIYLIIATDAATWLAAKILIVGLIFFVGVALDVLFKPAVEVFLKIVSEGATAERDQKYSKAISPVYKAVLAIYALVTVAAYLGLAKPII